MNVLINLIIASIRLIRPILGPHGCCKYQITCTNYIEIELKNNSFFTATKNIIKRIISCQPFF